VEPWKCGGGDLEMQIFVSIVRSVVLSMASKELTAVTEHPSAEHS